MNRLPHLFIEQSLLALDGLLSGVLNWQLLLLSEPAAFGGSSKHARSLACVGLDR